MRRAFGRDWVPDARDLKYPMRRTATARYSRTWSCGPVTDQGSTPHCVGHAWFGWLAAEPIKQRPISGGGIYAVAQFFDEWDGESYAGTSVRGGAKALKLTQHVRRYEWAFKLEDALPHLMEVGPIVLGLDWYDGMMDTDAAGFIHPTGRLAGGHAVLCYGADLRSGYARIRNSWGAAWGTHGNCKLSLDDLALLIAADGECCTAVESISTGI